MTVLSSANVFVEGKFQRAYLRIVGDKIDSVSSEAPSSEVVEDFGEYWILPGLVDTHVHINEPGRTDWEGFESATQAAAAGGITTLVDMPLNCIPATTSKKALAEKLASLKDKLFVDCGFWGGITPDNLADLPELLSAGVLGCKSFLIESGVEEFKHVDFSDVEKAMPTMVEAGVPYLFHAEWNAGSDQPSGELPSYDAFVKSRPAAWEVRAIDRIIELAERYGCHAHIVHLSAAEALPAIRQAKQRGVHLTVETCPHYLCFSSEEIDNQPKQRKGLYKCCPPIRSDANRTKLWDALADGTIDFVVSDHSPCTLDLKKLEDGDLETAWGGIMGLQSGFFAVLAESKHRAISVERVVEAFTAATAEFVGLEKTKGKIAQGFDADLVVINAKLERQIGTDELFQKNKASPYAGMKVLGQVEKTFLRGEQIYARGQPFSSPLGQTIGVKL